MVDFILNVFAEIADFFINFWVDKVIDKLAKRNKRRLMQIIRSGAARDDWILRIICTSLERCFRMPDTEE